MAERWMREAVEKFGATNCRTLHRLAEEAKDNLSDLVTRLRRVKLICIPTGRKRIYRSQDEFNGQGSLF